jgi:hypothetical protein
MKPRILVVLAVAGLAAVSAPAGRTVLSLDGIWRIADGKAPRRLPPSFRPVCRCRGSPISPARLRERGSLHQPGESGQPHPLQTGPGDWLETYWKGKVDQDRDYFWYQRTFRAPKPHAVAQLRIAKAQFGTAVWLNGRKIGEYAGCFTAGWFDLTDAIRWDEENTLVVRIGAHRPCCRTPGRPAPTSRRSSGRPASTTASR